MDELQLFTISEQIATVLRTAIADKASYVLITLADESEGIHIFSNLAPEIIVSLFSGIAQDLAGQTADVTVN